MATSLYNLFIELGKMDIPDGYTVSFTFNNGPREAIRLSVTGPDDIYATSWSVSKKELESNKLDFIKDNIDGMISYLVGRYKRNIVE